MSNEKPYVPSDARVPIDYWRLRDIAAATYRDLGDNEYEAIHGALAELLDMLDVARACALRARLIHKEDPATGNCLGCNTVGYCEDSVPWPCHTIRALHGIT